MQLKDVSDNPCFELTFKGDVLEVVGLKMGTDASLSLTIGEQQELSAYLELCRSPGASISGKVLAGITFRRADKKLVLRQHPSSFSIYFFSLTDKGCGNWWNELSLSVTETLTSFLNKSVVAASPALPTPSFGLSVSASSLSLVCGATP